MQSTQGFCFIIYKQFSISVWHIGCSVFPTFCSHFIYFWAIRMTAALSCLLYLLMLTVSCNALKGFWVRLVGKFIQFQFCTPSFSLQWCYEHEALILLWHIPQLLVLSMLSVSGNFDWQIDQILLNYMCFQFVRTCFICPMPIWSCKKNWLYNL